MVVSEGQISNIMGGMQGNAGIRLNNHKHKLRHRFDIVKKLGQGTYGKVQLAINKETGQDVSTCLPVPRMHRRCKRSQVVFENRDKMVLVMEYAAGGELYDYLSEKKVLSESEARRIFRQVASACYYCHKHKICHRDLKLENILLDEFGNAKIADFGLSNVFEDSRLLSTYCGSPLYASPEIVRGTPYTGPEVDCWSLGVLLYTLVYGAMPFDGSNFKKLVKQITAGDFYEPQKRSPASELIHALLTPSPQQRATMLDVCDHWWVNQDEEINCLEAAEELANQTPVRLDLLLSLAPQEPDKEHVMAQPAEAIVPPEADTEPSQAQFGASDSLSLASSAMEMEPGASPAPGDQPTEPATADKAAKRALDEGEEKATRKAEKARKKEGEKATKKKKKPPSEPPLPEEDVSMGEAAAAAVGESVQGAGQRVPDGEQKAAEPVSESAAVAAEEPQRPAEEGEAEPRPEPCGETPVVPEPTEEDFPAVEVPPQQPQVTQSAPEPEVVQKGQSPVGTGAEEGVAEPPVQPSQAETGEAEINRLSRVSSEGTQRPAPAAPRTEDRAQSLPPRRAPSKEYIIPIRLVDSSSDDGSGTAEELAPPPPAREALRKSPREFIIPIALEGGGTMTPTVQAQTKEEDREKGGSLFRTHQMSGQRRLGLSRPRMTSSTERADSLSSGGEDDDDDQFDFFTAESLFGNLMDRMKSLTKRMDMDGNPAKRSLLMGEPLRLDRTRSAGGSLSQRGLPAMPDLWDMHGPVKSLFDKPMTFRHGSLFDQSPFSRHSSFGSHPAASATSTAATAESSDSGGSQHEDESAPAGGTRHRTTIVRRTGSASQSPPKKPGEYFWRPTFDGRL
ncbi:NUAK family SNF1-like kinase 2 [Amphibalanus amphitrite]|uniref:NUAK family SNF1-like kinase 2 n=1 Tax=Amphibalanus amphitrite TaxID=1232801 RepID=A0A6A4XEQ7_AMPAM|nr:NUAK family SNF1-like kinase 2 [Amphibalanus amphitrite]